MTLYLPGMMLLDALLAKEWTGYIYLLRDVVVGILALGSAFVAWRRIR